MKRIVILFVIAVFTLTSCWNDAATTAKTESGSRIFAEKFEFEGHHYIMFWSHSIDIYDHCTGVVHDPDCPCHNAGVDEFALLPGFSPETIKKNVDAYMGQFMELIKAQEVALEAAEARDAAYRQYFEAINTQKTK